MVWKFKILLFMFCLKTAMYAAVKTTALLFLDPLEFIREVKEIYIYLMDA